MFLKRLFIFNKDTMSIFDWFRKKPVDRVDGGEVDVPAESAGDSEAAAHENSKNELAEEQESHKISEQKEKMKRFIVRISALMERIELLERKMDRVESRLGMTRDETGKN